MSNPQWTQANYRCEVLCICAVAMLPALRMMSPERVKQISEEAYQWEPWLSMYGQDRAIVWAYGSEPLDYIEVRGLALAAEYVLAERDEQSGPFLRDGSHPLFQTWPDFGPYLRGERFLQLSEPETEGQLTNA